MRVRFKGRKHGKLAVVFSGGGAKGVYSAGVSKALVECGIKPHIITGSSVGAMNAAILAETFLQWPRAGRMPQWRTDEIQRQIDFWETMSVQINGHNIHAASSSRLTPVILELILFNMAMGLTLLGFLPKILNPWIGLPAGLLSLGLAGRIGYQWFCQPFRRNLLYRNPAFDILGDDSFLRYVLDKYLNVHGFRKAIFSNSNLAKILSQFIPDHRRFSHYMDAGIDVKLTRTNIRTGYKEISEYLKNGDSKRITGDPLVLPSILASGAYPGAFPPVGLSALYDQENNPMFWDIIDKISGIRFKLAEVWGEGWESKYNDLLEYMDLWDMRLQEEGKVLEQLDASQTEEFIKDYLLAHGAISLVEKTKSYIYKAIPLLWKYRFYPCTDSRGEDIYFDGGVSDNTPISLAMEGLKDLMLKGEVDEDDEHLILVVMLSRPRRNFLTFDQLEQMNSLDLGLRGVSMLGLADMVDDMKNVRRINQLLKYAPKGTGKKVMANISTVYPDQQLPWVLAFDRRLGYRPGANGRFIAMGCRNTIEALLDAKQRGILPTSVMGNLEELTTVVGDISYCDKKACPYWENLCQRVLRILK